MHKTILITGSTGLFGRAFLQLADKSYTIYPNPEDTERLDITKKRDVMNFFKAHQPTIVVHAASIGSVDYCEQHKKEAYEVNVKGTRNIIAACKRYQAKLIFLSSNAIFDGTEAPYSEKSKPSPINYYGKTKLMGEMSIEKSGIPYAIVRLLLMYGWNNPMQRDNPVTWLLKKLESKQEVKLVNDTYTNPVYNEQAAEAVWQIIKKNKEGIFHIAGKDRVNRYEFGVMVAKIFGYDTKMILPVSSDYFSGIAPRMPDTTYDTKKMEKELQIKPFSLVVGLRKMKEDSNE